MRLLLSLLLLLASAACAGARHAEPGTPERPDIMLVFMDDMGYGDTSAFGHPRVRTEHIDRLAEEGIRFTRFHVASPVCSPSRVAITTATYPSRWRIHSYEAKGAGVEGNAAITLLIHPHPPHELIGRCRETPS